ncbi:hypothetical protein Naga_100020g37 [Nannochloropsis gaditana]|uniref:Uncharacterized protein n=1 Tax=Nannochloropsis gaditana TaxID=72520 RepID=W7TVC8_9STRA|nr:hypothetical protein Naga_100020g37 [Nannochloropsis gaditana]
MVSYNRHHRGPEESCIMCLHVWVSLAIHVPSSPSGYKVVPNLRRGTYWPHMGLSFHSHSSHSSAMPPSVIANCASASGIDGESTTLATRQFSRPFLRWMRVHEACANTLPPTGLTTGAKRLIAPGSAVH